MHKIMEGGAHIVVVDDDKEIRDLTARFLSRHGYRVTGARNGREMRETLAGSDVDLVVLDVMLPGEDGLSLCRELRAKSAIPIVMLTAMGEETDRIIGLEMGADDYLAKPFNPRELLARIKAVLRRSIVGEWAAREKRQLARFAGWTLDLIRRELVAPDGVAVDLSPGEYDMLLAFVEHPGRVLSREQLLEFARSRTIAGFDRSIDVQVSRLRKKMQRETGEQDIIKTVRGAGYIFTPAVERA
jgi:two-component system OmpR family response regulator